MEKTRMPTRKMSGNGRLIYWPDHDGIQDDLNERKNFDAGQEPEEFFERLNSDNWHRE